MAFKEVTKLIKDRMDLLATRERRQKDWKEYRSGDLFKVANRHSQTKLVPPPGKLVRNKPYIKTYLDGQTTLNKLLRAFSKSKQFKTKKGRIIFPEPSSERVTKVVELPVMPRGVGGREPTRSTVPSQHIAGRVRAKKT